MAVPASKHPQARSHAKIKGQRVVPLFRFAVRRNERTAQRLQFATPNRPHAQHPHLEDVLQKRLCFALGPSTPWKDLGCRRKEPRLLATSTCLSLRVPFKGNQKENHEFMGGAPKKDEPPTCRACPLWHLGSIRGSLRGWHSNQLLKPGQEVRLAFAGRQAAVFVDQVVMLGDVSGGLGIYIYIYICIYVDSLLLGNVQHMVYAAHSFIGVLVGCPNSLRTGSRPSLVSDWTDCPWHMCLIVPSKLL